MNDYALNSLDDRAEARCETCPLNRVEAGVALRIKKLAASPDIQIRLRELGFCEERIIRLLTSHTSYICLVCNGRFALSPKLAEVIIVEPLKALCPKRPHRQSDEAATLHRRAADLSTQTATVQRSHGTRFDHPSLKTLR